MSLTHARISACDSKRTLAALVERARGGASEITGKQLEKLVGVGLVGLDE
jgi:hypothetical protein